MSHHLARAPPPRPPPPLHSLDLAKPTPSPLYINISSSLHPSAISLPAGTSHCSLQVIISCYSSQAAPPLRSTSSCVCVCVPFSKSASKFCKSAARYAAAYGILASRLSCSIAAPAHFLVVRGQPFFRKNSQIQLGGEYYNRASTNRSLVSTLCTK